MSSTLNIPRLVEALCYHLAVKDSSQIYTYDIYVKSQARTALYEKYRDIAFSQLLGVGPVARQGWTQAEDDWIQDKECDGNLVRDDRLLLLQRRLVQGGEETVDAGAPRMCELLLPVEFRDSDASQQAFFVCSEGEQVIRFLEYLECSSTENEEAVHVQDVMVGEGAQHNGLNRGFYITDAPGKMRGGSFEVSCDGGVDEGEGMNPSGRGWFVNDNEAMFRGIHQAQQSATGQDQFAYRTSKSPIKISIGSLFVDQSPGKMTYFDQSVVNHGPQRRSGLYERLQEIEMEQAQKQEVPRGVLREERRGIWSGEESQIARDALLALCGVHSSLKKLRSRLKVPHLLPRPASFDILSTIDRACSSRLCIEVYIRHVLKEKDDDCMKDPISQALVHGLKGILHEIDRDLVDIETNGSENCMKPIGMEIASQDDFENSIAGAHGVQVQGAEFHGLGMSVLQLAHATAKAQSTLSFLSSFLGLTLEQDDDDAMSHVLPQGKELLELLYRRAVLLEGDQAEIAKRLVLSSLVPFLSIMNSWAFGVDSFEELTAFTQPLSNEYSMNLPKPGRSTFGSSAALNSRNMWMSNLGPGYVPSFFSEESKKSLLIAGTQLRLLFSISDSVHGASSVAMSLGEIMHCDGLNHGRKDSKSWFHLSEALSSAEKNGRLIREGASGEFASLSSLVLSEKRNVDVRRAKLAVVEEWIENLINETKETLGIQIGSMSRMEILEEMFESPGLPLPVLLETSVGDMLSIQASVLSHACVRIFLDYLNIKKLLLFVRGVFMGFAGDFLLEFVQNIEPSVFSMEELSLHRARSAVLESIGNSSLSEDIYSEFITVDLLPGDTAVTLVEEAFRFSPQYSDAVRVKAPYYSAMAPMLIPPSGFDALDCIYLSMKPTWPFGVVFSDDVLTAYSAIFNMRVRVQRAEHALKRMQGICRMRGLVKKVFTGLDPQDWIERYKMFCSFCFHCSRHLNAIEAFQRACCNSSSWTMVDACFSSSSYTQEGYPKSIHDMIGAHRKYVYQSASRITSCCNSPAVRNTMDDMLSHVLALRNILEGKTRLSHDLEDILGDFSSWSDIRRIMRKYAQQARAMKEMSDALPLALTEDELILHELLSAF